MLEVGCLGIGSWVSGMGFRVLGFVFLAVEVVDGVFHLVSRVRGGIQAVKFQVWG